MNNNIPNNDNENNLSSDVVSTEASNSSIIEATVDHINQLINQSNH